MLGTLCHRYGRVQGQSFSRLMIIGIGCRVVRVNVVWFDLSFVAEVVMIPISLILTVIVYDRWLDSLGVFNTPGESTNCCGDVGCGVAHYSIDRSRQWLLSYSALSVVYVCVSLVTGYLG